MSEAKVHVVYKYTYDATDEITESRIIAWSADEKGREMFEDLADLMNRNAPSRFVTYTYTNIWKESLGDFDDRYQTEQEAIG